MPTGGQTTFRFGPIAQPRGWSYTMTPGIQPSSVVVTLLASDIEALTSPIHNVTIEESAGSGIELFDCHLVRGRNRGGSKLVQCTLLDRRWRWQYAHIDGHYNIRKPDGTYDREKTPRELAALLFGSMLEQGYDVEALPDTLERPEVNWQGANSANELSSLCSLFGCYPTLHINTDTAEIHAIGLGDDVPEGGLVVNRSQVISATPLPKTIRVVGGPVLFQTRLRLGEALGEEPDGELKPLAELSYLTELGEEEGEPAWRYEHPEGFHGVTGTYEKEGKTLKLRDLAIASCYKIFRIDGQAAAEESAEGKDLWSPEELNGDGDGESDYAPEKLTEILPLRGTKLTTHTDREGRKVENQATIHGRFMMRWGMKQDMFEEYLVEDGEKYPGGFSIDAARGIVRFNDHLFIKNETDDDDDPYYEVPAMELETSYPTNKEGVFTRFEQFRENDNESAFGSFREPIPDLVVKIVETSPQTSNREDIKDIAEKYLDNLVRKFEVRAGVEVEFSRLLLVPLSGIVRQVTYSGVAARSAHARGDVDLQHRVGRDLLA